MNKKNQERQKGETISGSMGSAAALTSEVLILPDGRVLAHDLTPFFADLLRQLSPDDPHWATLGEASIGLRHTACRAAQVPPPRTERDSDAST